MAVPGKRPLSGHDVQHQAGPPPGKGEYVKRGKYQNKLVRAELATKEPAGTN